MKEEELKRLEEGKDLLYQIRKCRNEIEAIEQAKCKLGAYPEDIMNVHVDDDILKVALENQEGRYLNKIDELQKKFDEL